MLRLLIKQSWVLILLLIAIPTAIWQFLNREESHHPTSTIQQETQRDGSFVTSTVITEESSPCVTRPQHPIRYQTETVIQPDSIPCYMVEQTDSLTEMTQVPETEEEEKSTPDTLIYQQIPLTAFDDTHFIATTKSKKPSWNISLVYNGQMGRGDDYLAATSIGKGSFNAASNTFIPMQFNNWIDYNAYLNNASTIAYDAETRSIMNIAMLNSSVNGGVMEARYEHKLPISFQILLSRQLSKRLSVKTGLSYTQLNSTCTSGSLQAYIQEQQRLHYLGIPLRLGWQWYNKAHLSLYSSAGAMLEWPIQSRVDILHRANSVNTFQKESSLNAPNQWSATFGLGLQYDFTPHLGFYIEPSLQYFFNDGSDIQSYRTEHPLQITLPIGISVHW